jgi:hypothetical protein
MRTILAMTRRYGSLAMLAALSLPVLSACDARHGMLTEPVPQQHAAALELAMRIGDPIALFDAATFDTADALRTAMHAARCAAVAAGELEHAAIVAAWIGPLGGALALAGESGGPPLARPHLLHVPEGAVAERGLFCMELVGPASAEVLLGAWTQDSDAVWTDRGSEGFELNVSLQVGELVLELKRFSKYAMAID